MDGMAEKAGRQRRIGAGQRATTCEAVGAVELGTAVMVWRVLGRTGEVGITSPFHRKPAAVRLAYPQARCFIDHPDGVAARAQRRAPPFDFSGLRSVDGEAQFIIVAGAERDLRPPRLAEGGGHLAKGGWQRRCVEYARGAHAARCENVAEI